MTGIYTDRLILREFIIEDAPFMLALLNSSGFLEFIGDRGVRSEEAARNYLRQRVFPPYEVRGCGLWLVS